MSTGSPPKHRCTSTGTPVLPAPPRQACRAPNLHGPPGWHVEGEYWRHASTKTSRHIDSVVLPTETKVKVIGDLDGLLSKESFRFYNKHGIPYKRSYLFHGVPGAGKTSLITAIAGKYRRNLCIMQPTDPRITDAEAIKEAPSRSIIVLEDIDAPIDKNRDTKNSKMNISFCGLLNALDGVSNPDGKIFVLTTNFRENLDSTLIRNGRVDLHVHFSHATAEQIEKLFLQFYPEDPALAQPFREAVQQQLGEKPVNMAAIQHFFIRQMRTPALDVAASVHTILDDLNEKDAEASTKQEKKDEKKDGARGKAGGNRGQHSRDCREDVVRGTCSSARRVERGVRSRAHGSPARSSQRALNPLFTNKKMRNVASYEGVSFSLAFSLSLSQ